MAGPLGLLRRQVDAHVAIGERHDLDRAPATDQGAGAGQQLLEGERLAQVVVGAAVEAAHPVADRVARREKEHGRRCRPRGDGRSGPPGRPVRAATSRG